MQYRARNIFSFFFFWTYEIIIKKKISRVSRKHLTINQIKHRQSSQSRVINMYNLQRSFDV